MNIGLYPVRIYCAESLSTWIGTFSVVERQPRLARNPKTGEKVQVPYRKIVKFKLSKQLKNLFRQAQGEAAAEEKKENVIEESVDQENPNSEIAPDNSATENSEEENTQGQDFS